MNSSVNSLSNEEYEDRKRVLGELKKLVRSEQEQIFLIVKKYRLEYSENSNGVFFDLSNVESDVFTKLFG